MGELRGGHLSRRTAANWKEISGSSGKSCVALLRLLAILSCTLLVTVQQTEAAVSHTQYRIKNTALALNLSGGFRFQEILGVEEAVELLQSAKELILTTFNLSKDIRPVYQHTIFVDNSTAPGAPAVTSADPNAPCSAVTDLSAIYVGNIYPNDSSAWLNEVTGVLMHESTHVWQNNNGSYDTDQGFHGVIEGIADYMRLKSEHYLPSPTVGVRHSGGNWSDGYSTTAYFLDWIEKTHVRNFVNQLNAKMANSFTADFFQDITGQSVDQLWTDYQLFLAANQPALTTFLVNNTALDTCGGLRFENDLGTENMLQVLRIAKSFIVQQFTFMNISQEKSFSNVTLFVDNMTGVADTFTGIPGVTAPEIHLSAIYVDSLPQGDLEGLSYEITGVLTHESTHVWQNNNGSYGSDPVFTGVIEGIADFIRLRSQYPARHWVKAAGGVWYSGYSTTAFFFDWIDATLFPGFVDQLNYMMVNTWDVNFFKLITGMSVDDLWTAYQASLTAISPSPQSGH